MSKIADKKIDPIIVEIVGNLLLSIAEEMGAALIRSAYSSNIKERKDCSTAIFDTNGKMVAQAEHIPMHLGSMLGIIEEIMKKYSVDELVPGDMFIANDPYAGGGTHLPDITVAAPVFVDKKLVAWVANIAHHSDVGGKVPGSTSGDATSIFQEGIRIPIIKFCKEEQVIQDVFNFILTNCRTPQERVGDLQAQVAANKVGIQRIKEVSSKYGDRLGVCMEELQDYAEKRLRAGIAKVKNGNYSFIDYMDNDGITKDPVPITVNITVEDNFMKLDFTGTSPQVLGPINVTKNGLLATVFYSLKALIDPEIPSNAGIYRAFEVTAPEGLIINSVAPAPVGERIDTCQRVVDVIFGAMSQAIPNRVIAACNSAVTTATFSGVDPRTNQFFVYLETIGGGSGASYNQDGMSGVQVHMTNTSNLPVEALEIEYPLMVRQYSLRTNSGGAGKFRGGLGIQRDIQILSEDVTFSGLSDRQEIAPWGLFEGKEGGCGAYYSVKGDNVEKLGSKCSNIALKKGDYISVLTPGAGGYGDPIERDPQLVLNDLIERKISKEKADELYGVVICQKSNQLEVDAKSTIDLRKKLGRK